MWGGFLEEVTMALGVMGTITLLTQMDKNLLVRFYFRGDRKMVHGASACRKSNDEEKCF